MTLDSTVAAYLANTATAQEVLAAGQYNAGQILTALADASQGWRHRLHSRQMLVHDPLGSALHRIHQEGLVTDSTMPLGGRLPLNDVDFFAANDAISPRSFVR